MSVQTWLVESQPRPLGPFTSRELAARAASGELKPADRVSPDGQRWKPAARVRGLTFPEPTAELPALPSYADAPPLLELPGYTVTGVLGSGACGAVLRAYQQSLERYVALKTVPLAPGVAPDLPERLRREVVALARLQHPNVVQVFDAGRAGDRFYFTMELLEGEDLAQRLEREGPMGEAAGWLVARQAAAALAHAADSGVTHRDIKPANLFLVDPPAGSALPTGVPMVKVTDFGLARTRQPEDALGDDAVRLTRIGTVVGTPAYMAPEQFASADVDGRADTYALGVTLLHTLTGRRPWEGAGLWEVMTGKLEPVELPASLSSETRSLLAVMLHPKPDGRPGTHRELIARIDALACVGGRSCSLAPGFAGERVRVRGSSVR